MSRKQKLELTWIGKEVRPRLEPGILLEDPEKSYHAPHRITDDDIFDNRPIFGECTTSSLVYLSTGLNLGWQYRETTNLAHHPVVSSGALPRAPTGAENRPRPVR